MNRLTAEAPVLVRADGPVARVTINRPEKRNVLGKEAFYPATWHRR